MPLLQALSLIHISRVAYPQTLEHYWMDAAWFSYICQNTKLKKVLRMYGTKIAQTQPRRGGCKSEEKCSGRGKEFLELNLRWGFKRFPISGRTNRLKGRVILYGGNRKHGWLMWRFHTLCKHNALTHPWSFKMLFQIVVPYANSFP